MVAAPLNELALRRLSQALSFWGAHGYQFVNLPWLVPQRIANLTKPAFVTTEDPVTDHGTMVASGEQSFLKLWEEGALEDGQKYIGWTPCFRNETQFDATHHFYFLKAELFCPSPRSTAEMLREHLEGSQKLFAYVANAHLPVREVCIATGQIDLELEGMEIGSYGHRNVPGLGAYSYGTALAEPRFSTALERYAHCR